MKRFGVSLVGCALSLGAVAGCQFEVAGNEEASEKTGQGAAAISTCATIPGGAAALCDLGGGSVRFQVSLPSGQRYVELFVRQDGIQNVATNIVRSGIYSGNGITTYSLVASGYKPGQRIEYRFYSYKPDAPGVFTPGPIEGAWITEKLGSVASGADIAVAKDATLINTSLCCGPSADKNFGANTTVDVGSYHHDVRALFGYPLTAIPAGATITKAEWVVPTVTVAGALTGEVSVQRVNDGVSWLESSVTYNSRPAVTPFKNAEFGRDLANRLDVTELVEAARAAGQSELGIYLAPVRDNLFFNSKENANGNAPYLHVEWR